MRGQRDRRRRVAADGLEQDRRGREVHLAQLFGDEEAMRLVAHDDGTGGARKPGEARGGLLDHRALARERKELLRQQLARQRPQPGAGAAGEDDGDEFHGRNRTRSRVDRWP